ncbi:MAG: iron-containing alcohol dehydrogenase [SAR202 cluster bacterium]|nr:iron-containing alcohol dehydrogenase [SAR202 cluster bacterium]|tara:strand:- start:76199 stop:77476 length:1278 start_codon:yes stop_codon:yes gene_type:complete
MRFETAFSIDTSSIKFGPGVSLETGYELNRLGSKKVMVLTDHNVVKTKIFQDIINSINNVKIKFSIYKNVLVEPTDKSFKDAIEYANAERVDGFVAIGGGSTIDTAKAANLYSTYQENFLTYVNAPIGMGKNVPGPLKPLVAIPTTTGTGSETTGISIFDFLEIKAKTGIAHRYLRPNVGLIDPNVTDTLPSMVIACSGLDVLCHGLESYTALPYHNRIAPKTPEFRPSYQGSNPISDVWSAKAIQMVGDNIISAVNEPDNKEARSNMLLAATYAGVGFGNAGCHLPHGMSYPVSGMVSKFIPNGYFGSGPIIPHGMSVALNAPAVFKFTGFSNPDRHLNAARFLGKDITHTTKSSAGEILANAVIEIMQKVGMPNGLKSVGYSEKDVPQLVAGTLPQHRVTKLTPIPFTSDDLRDMFLDSMDLW